MENDIRPVERNEDVDQSELQKLRSERRNLEKELKIWKERNCFLRKHNKNMLKKLRTRTRMQ